MNSTEGGEVGAIVTDVGQEVGDISLEIFQKDGEGQAPPHVEPEQISTDTQPEKPMEVEEELPKGLQIVPTMSEGSKPDLLENDLILSEVKEQVLKEVEEMKDMPNLDSSAVSTVDIENLLEPKDLPLPLPQDDLKPIITNVELGPVHDLQPEPEVTPGHEPEQENEHEHETETESEVPEESNPQVNMEDMKVAQEELRVLDILVCGSCHQVVHFVDAFVMHKPICKGKSNFHGNIAETKSQVWAFLLWKNAQSKLSQKTGTPSTESSWKLYQKWCKMPSRIREAWVAAGETVMNFSTFGYSKTGESVLKTPIKKPGENQKSDIMETNEEDGRKPVVMRKLVQRDPAGEIKEIRPTAPSNNKKIHEDIENIRNQLEDGDSSQDKLTDLDSFEAEAPRISFQKFLRVKPSTKEGVIGMDTVQEEEFVVEKIVSRRFNPRKKQYEYLLKWEGYPSEQNTWEPAENLEACQHLLKAFEESLSKQSASKPASKPTNVAVAKKTEVTQQQPGPSGLNSFGRPVRYSKQKALNQVKAWCGSIKPDDAELETLKRRAPVTDSEDEDDGVLKRLKSEFETDSEDSLGGRIYYNKAGGMSGIIKKSARGRGAGYNRNRIVQNGTSNPDNLAAVLGLESSGDEADGKKLALEMLNRKSLEKRVSSLSPANQQVLVANAKGVVKVDPSQVPNLSSGVYIMSNKSGIIKLDSVSPSKALSLKQGPVKEVTAIAPKPAMTSTITSGSVVMLNKQNQNTTGIQRTGILRKNTLTNMGRGGNSNTVIQRGIGRPSRPPGNIKITNPNTSGSAAARSNVNVTPSVKPKLPLKTTVTQEPQKKALEIERRVLGSKIGRGGFPARGGFKGRGGITIGGPPNNSISDTDSIGSKGKDKDADSIFRDMAQESQSSDSDPGIPDDFPADLPPIEPESPPRPLTLCPETGKVLSKAEGERTPEPTPPPSPVVIKQEEPEKPSTLIKQKEDQPFLSRVNSTKDNTILKKTLGRPGTTGSIVISPKKSIQEEEDNDSEFVTITGEDGLLYKVSKAELNNTLLVSGEDGQQCVYVTTGENGDENAAVLALGSTYSDTVAQLEGVNILGTEGEETQFYVKESEDGELLSLEVQGQDGSEDGQSQLVAQLVEAGEPAPGGGPRRVVLLLPDGNLMMTEVDEEQYAALELDKFQTTTEME
ncbi:uncharacterized protein LOC106668253 isoform X2 [Cimex lectularius]|uniref:Chromo domain-containing protein n=1 Tax=Cimex lectularius TaxID=79782 RepID=A0A8I6TFJ0_CIMLE|nr:uncharacterized protein LOC106668253 isoform X2 [Cimex lectularius]